MLTSDQLLARFDGVRRAGRDRWVARCPAHDDRHPSLSLRPGDKGNWLLHCHAGCGVDEVISAAGLAWRDIEPDRPLWHRHKGNGGPAAWAGLVAALHALEQHHIRALALAPGVAAGQDDTEDLLRAVFSAADTVREIKAMARRAMRADVDAGQRRRVL